MSTDRRERAGAEERGPDAAARKRDTDGIWVKFDGNVFGLRTGTEGHERSIGLWLGIERRFANMRQYLEA